MLAIFTIGLAATGANASPIPAVQTATIDSGMGYVTNINVYATGNIWDSVTANMLEKCVHAVNGVNLLWINKNPMYADGTTLVSMPAVSSSEKRCPRPSITPSPSANPVGSGNPGVPCVVRGSVSFNGVPVSGAGVMAIPGVNDSTNANGEYGVDVPSGSTVTIRVCYQGCTQSKSVITPVTGLFVDNIDFNLQSGKECNDSRRTEWRCESSKCYHPELHLENNGYRGYHEDYR